MNKVLSLLNLPLWRKIGIRYSDLFSIPEIERNTKLQLLFGAMLLYFFSTFSQWADSTTLTVENSYRAVCWPYFQNCTDFYFLHALPYGYSQNVFYMALFALMLLTCYWMWERKWVAAHALLSILWLWKFTAIFVLSYSIGGVYDSYHLLICAALLFVPYKEYFAKVAFVVLYFVSATIKFYPTWTLGTYFTTLELGLPLFPDYIAAFLTLTVIFEQVIGCWFLLSKNWLRQRLTLAYFSLFHLYAGVLVLFNYSLISFSTLFILFGPLYQHQRPPLTRKSIAGWMLIAIIILFQTPVHLIRGDEKYTLEGYRFGMWMFDANHQCVVTFTSYANPGGTLSPSSWQAPRSQNCTGYSCLTRTSTFKKDGQWIQTRTLESPNAESRCSPYTFWQANKYLCDENTGRVAMREDHAINGGPYYRIVDEPDMCNLTYKTFSHNDWIKSPPEAPIVGFSRSNTYFSYSF
jgi:hypothetical protein